MTVFAKVFQKSGADIVDGLHISPNPVLAGDGSLLSDAKFPI